MTRQNFSGGSPFEPVIGFSRAVRAGNMIFVSGTGPVGADNGNAEEQTRRVLAIVRDVLERAGAAMEDVVRTRIYLRHTADWEVVGKVHGEVFAGILPAATMIGNVDLLHPGWLVEIEADAVVASAA